MRTPSFKFYDTREEKAKDLATKIEADTLLSYAFRKGGRLKAYQQFIRNACDESYELGQKEILQEFGGCDLCHGRGFFTIVDLAEKRDGTAPVRSAFCFCPRGADLKGLLDRFYVRKDVG